jgi:hypothetical protein
MKIKNVTFGIIICMTLFIASCKKDICVRCSCTNIRTGAITSSADACDKSYVDAERKAMQNISPDSLSSTGCEEIK